MSAPIDVLLAERLEISEEQAQTLLQTMLQELRNRAREEGVRLPQFGTFREEDGTLSFTPSPSLRRLVNQEYEGLSPEDLSSAPPPPSQEEDESIPTILDRPSREAEEAPPDAEREPSAAPKSEGAFEDDEPESEYAPSAKPAAASQERTTEAESDAVEAEEDAGADYSFDSFHVIIGILLTVLLAGGVWFMLDRTGALSSRLPSESQEASATGSRNDPSTPADPQTEPSASQEKTSERARGAPPGETPDSAQAAGQWTIVVASTSDRASAEDVAEKYKKRFSDRSLPISVVPGTVDNTTRYRVTIGQYESEASAEQALDQYRSNLPSGAWSLRLR